MIATQDFDLKFLVNIGLLFKKQKPLEDEF